MVLSIDFIEFYNKLFEWVHDGAGHTTFRELCENICPLLVQDLSKLTERYGLNGAALYWNRLFKAEGGEAQIDLKEGSLVLHVEACPSKVLLGDKAFEHYCDHCKYLYPAVFEKLGYKCIVSKKLAGDYQCRIEVKRLSSSETEATQKPART